MFEFGGKGCADTVHKALAQAFDKYGYEYRLDFNFRSIGEFAPLLENTVLRWNMPAFMTDPPLKTAKTDLKTG